MKNTERHALQLKTNYIIYIYQCNQFLTRITNNKFNKLIYSLPIPEIQLIMATNIRVQKHLSKGNQGIAEPAQNQQPGSDLTNYKGIYFAEEPGQKFQEKSTGAHFEFIDMCRRLNIAQEQRKRREARERATEDINRGEEEDIGRMQEKMRSKLKESRDQQFMNRRESDREASSRNIIHGGLPQQGFGTVGGPLQHPLPTYGHAGGEQVIHKSMDQGSFDKIAIHGNTQNPKLHSKVPSIVRRGGNRDPGYSLRLPRSKEGDKAADSGDINCNININPNIEQRKRGNNSSIIERVPNLIRHKAELEMILANKTVNRKHIDRNNSLKQSASFKQTSTTVDTMNTGYGDNSGGYLNQGNTNNEEGIDANNKSLEDSHTAVMECEEEEEESKPGKKGTANSQKAQRTYMVQGYKQGPNKQQLIKKSSTGNLPALASHNYSYLTTDQNLDLPQNTTNMKELSNYSRNSDKTLLEGSQYMEVIPTRSDVRNYQEFGGSKSHLSMLSEMKGVYGGVGRSGGGRSKERGGASFLSSSGIPTGITNPKGSMGSMGGGRRMEIPSTLGSRNLGNIGSVGSTGVPSHILGGLAPSTKLTVPNINPRGSGAGVNNMNNMGRGRDPPFKDMVRAIKGSFTGINQNHGVHSRNMGDLSLSMKTKLKRKSNYTQGAIGLKTGGVKLGTRTGINRGSLGGVGRAGYSYNLQTSLSTRK